MPCSSCYDLFTMIPCIHSTGELHCNKSTKTEFDGKYFLINIDDSMISPSTRQRLKNLYKLLHDQCPCKECLVKSICCRNSPDCETYYSLVTQANV
jgi:hypothetical protein